METIADILTRHSAGRNTSKNYVTVRDSQRKKCYKTEKRVDFLAASETTSRLINRQNVLDIVRESADWAGVEPVRNCDVLDLNRAGYSGLYRCAHNGTFTASDGRIGTIKGGPRAYPEIHLAAHNGRYNRRTTIHECVHHVVQEHYGYNHQAHGPEFVAIVMAFYVLFGHCSVLDVCSALEHTGVKIDRTLWLDLVAIIDPDNLEYASI